MLFLTTYNRSQARPRAWDGRRTPYKAFKSGIQRNLGGTPQPDGLNKLISHIQQIIC